MFTINEAAAATGWSPRMLRYVEQLGLVATTRSSAGYRLYGPQQVDRLRSLRVLLETHSLELGDVGFALRMRQEAELSAALDTWLDTTTPDTTTPERPETPDVVMSLTPDADWLAFEQDKHQHLLHL